MLKNCRWYLYFGESVFIQKLLGEWNYWDKDGWHVLSERVRDQLHYDVDKNRTLAMPNETLLSS